MADENIILSVQDLRISFEGEQSFTAVKDISFTIARGKTLAIVGESGSGKSLTALALMGLLPKTAILNGNLFLTTKNNVRAGASPAPTTYDLRLTTNNIRGKEISMVFQEPMSALNPVMKIGKQLQEAIMTHQEISRSEGKKLALEWLRKVQLPEPEKMYSRYPHQISGGQKQRVMIAIALCNYPTLLIADEPTTALDATVQQEIIRLLQYLQQEHHTALVFITHDLALAAAVADDVCVMYQGEMVEYGPVENILQNPQHPYTKALLSCRPSTANKGHRLPIVSDFIKNENTEQIIYASVKNRPDFVVNETQKFPGTLIEANRLNVWFPEHTTLLGKPDSWFKAVSDVTFSINKGEILGLAGESGCGKSTLSRALIGLLPVNSGEIMFNGVNLAAIPLKQWKQVRTKIQMIFQDPYSSLNPRMTIGDALKEPLLVHRIVPGKDITKEALRLLDLVQLPANAMQRYPHEFSGGQRQRIGIARALALRPELLICDECVSALDVSIQAQILNLLKDLQQEFQLTFLFISHDLGVVHYISDRVMIMNAGKIVETGSANEVLRHPANEYTKKLIGAMPGGTL